jgi:hypothetical protein
LMFVGVMSGFTQFVFRLVENIHLPRVYKQVTLNSLYILILYISQHAGTQQK